jgi:hypothetical protein
MLRKISQYGPMLPSLWGSTIVCDLSLPAKKQPRAVSSGELNGGAYSMASFVDMAQSGRSIKR